MNINEAFKLAYQYHLSGNLEQAEHIYKQILEVRQDFADVHYNLGIIYQTKGKLDEAIRCYREVLHLNPTESTYYNLAIALQWKRQYDEAINYYQRAIDINPNNAEAFSNLGQCLQGQGKIEEAINSYQKAISIKPTLAGAHLNLSLALLLSGNFKRGWQEFEWRWKTEEFHQRNFTEPQWNGSDIKGQTILLYAEQGLGDTIQFIRYAQIVEQKGAIVIVECQRELKSILQNVKGIKQIIIRGEKLPYFDVHCSLLSLPLIFNTTIENIPVNIPYITPDSKLIQKWRDRVCHDNQFKIGLVWSGRLTHEQDIRYRSCSLDNFKPFSQLKGVNIYSIQKGEGAKQAKYPPEGLKLIDYTEQIDDFSDTAAFIENLDLIISVDTAAVHLAGALGKPVWLLLPFAPDWRWLLNREDSPWYPTIKLFRQPFLGDWGSAIDRVLQKLNKIVRH